MSAQHKHTAGPWRVETWSYQGRGNKSVVIGGNDAICEIHDLWCPEDRDAERVANAALISVSPDLLQCLEDVMQDLFGRLNHGVSMEHMQAAAAAIAKAKGERP